MNKIVKKLKDELRTAEFLNRIKKEDLERRKNGNRKS